MNKLTQKQRLKNMKANKSKGSKIEVLLAKAMWKKGLRYRKNDKGIFGNPDFTFRGKRVAVFCDGEFWHGKDWSSKKQDHKSNIKFWHKKIERNIERDKEVNEHLAKEGWRVLRFWGKEIEKDVTGCSGQIELALNTVQNIAHDIINSKQMEKVIINLEMNDLTAPFTHYLYTSKHDFSATYKAGALEYVQNVLRPDLPDEVAESALQDYLFELKKQIPFPEPEKPTFKFIDLFAGIGGFSFSVPKSVS